MTTFNIDITTIIDTDNSEYEPPNSDAGVTVEVSVPVDEVTVLALSNQLATLVRQVLYIRFPAAQIWVHTYGQAAAPPHIKTWKRWYDDETGEDLARNGYEFVETGARVTNADLYAVRSRGDALSLGIPAAVLDLYEDDTRYYIEGGTYEQVADVGMVPPYGESRPHCDLVEWLGAPG